MDFETFWKLYPRKADKVSAQKAWKKLNPDAELIAKIVEAVENAKKSEQWKQDGGKYIPYPATYLNHRRWEDAVIVQDRYGNFDPAEAFENAIKRSMES